MQHVVGYFVGSLAKESINRKFATSLVVLAPEGIEFREIGISDLPLYNRDLDAAPPATVVAFKDAIAACDALLYVTPEYNRSIPGPLKNAIDWASRPRDARLLSKPSALAGVSGGPIGTAVAQAHLRSMLGFFGAVLYTQPELYIQWKADLIGADGQFRPDTAQFLTGWMSGLAAFLDKQLG